MKQTKTDKRERQRQNNTSQTSHKKDSLCYSSSLKTKTFLKHQKCSQ